MTSRISKVLKEEIDRITKDRGDIEILNKETDRDHIHILFRATPTTNLAKVVNVLKGVTSRKLRQQFPELKEQRALWSPTYFIASTGEVTLDQLKQYVESQGGK
ncbi:MAG: IS200/IS605 family transposase [Candidatus Korarchaeota archaeon]|nr:IS200/IS605 family transposase [Candidatus Korarchaeota archaeon]NIU85576.1 IS200/IS605 family transposase [Candidatus Thorarchaeota archaeon]NIW15120.1 IS200/IS605 family transposase [Candidatus Thorarchaeota archaeon]NIW53125.1 IS200/IS605 family transposase [Candidatus Korarchaeota archaeon]